MRNECVGVWGNDAYGLICYDSGKGVSGYFPFTTISAQDKKVCWWAGHLFNDKQNMANTVQVYSYMKIKRFLISQY